MFTMKPAIPSYVTALMNLLISCGYECYVVGGAVRSALLNLLVHDYDLTTSARPEEMKQVFHGYRTIETGIRHGTLTVLSEGHPIEITTYRKESSYGDHRHPDRVEFTSALREDCARRDFTVNALCCTQEGNVLDFFEGEKDLKKKIIRCIGNPDERFDEDALRILRALRFAARLSFSIERATADALHRNKVLLSYISAERIRAEFDGFLEAPGCPDLLREYRDVIEVFLPELKDLTEQQWNRLTDQLERAPDDSAVRLALILSDTEDAEEILKRLKYSNASIKLVLSLTGGKEKPAASAADIRRAIRDYQKNTMKWISFRCAADPALDRNTLADLYSRIIADGDCCSLKELAVSGDDLVKAGFRGKQISEVLSLLLEEVIEKRLPNSRPDLIKYTESLKKW